MKGHTRMRKLQLPSFPLCIRIPLLVHHHTKLFVAQFVVLKGHCVIISNSLSDLWNLIIVSIIFFGQAQHITFDLKVIMVCLSHLVLVEFLESGVNFWFAQPPPSCSLRKGQFFLYDFDVFVLKSGLAIKVFS